MAESIADIVGGYAKAWQAGEIATIFAAYHDDFVLHYNGRNALSGRHTGKAAALAALGEFSRRSNRKLVEIVSVMGGENRGAIIARERLGPDGAAIEVDRLLVYAVADGKLAECWVYDADQDTIDRLIDAV